MDQFRFKGKGYGETTVFKAGKMRDILERQRARLQQIRFDIEMQTLYRETQHFPARQKPVGTSENRNEILVDSLLVGFGWFFQPLYGKAARFEKRDAEFVSPYPLRCVSARGKEIQRDESNDEKFPERA